jgi:hypothetical protein
MAGTDDQLKDWFAKLSAMQQAASENLDTPPSICDFAQAKVTDLLPRSADQDQFRFKLNGILIIGKSDITNANTFLDLLDEVFLPLDPFIFAVFQSVAGEFDNTFNSMTPKQFGSTLSNQVFTTSERTAALIRRLAVDMPSCWFPDTKKAKLQTQLADPANKISDSVAFVAKLG